MSWCKNKRREGRKHEEENYEILCVTFYINKYQGLFVIFKFNLIIFVI